MERTPLPSALIGETYPTHKAAITPYSDDEFHTSALNGSSKRKKLRNLTLKTKTKTKKLLNVDSSKSEAEPENLEALRKLKDDPAFNPSELVNQKTSPTGGKTDKPIDVFQSIVNTVTHPKRTVITKVKKTTAGNLSTVQRPLLSQRADLNFLEAHENLSRAESTSSSRHAISGEEDEEWEDPATAKYRDKVATLEAHRESLRVAWTTDHIKRVKVVPKRQIMFPETEAFIERDEKGSQTRYKWEKWLGYILIYYTQDFSTQYIDDFEELPFDINTLKSHVERTVLASAPWQSWALNVRSVYQWKNPATTGKWFALYLVLWYTENVMGFLWLYIIFLVVKNRYYPTSVQSLQESVRRTADQEGIALELGELIDKHGREDWLDPLIDELGPYIQLQIGDIANMLEVFINFYSWKSPRKTVSSLSFFTACLLVSLFADMKFCMKIFWFIAGGSFFLCWPIASLYPRYRYLVSPFKWVLWDIPTHAEWSFQYLRHQAQLSRAEMIGNKVEKIHSSETALFARDKSKETNATPHVQLDADVNGSSLDESDTDDDWHSVSSSTSILSQADILPFRAQWQGVMGKLIIYSSGIRFVGSLPHKELWRIPYLDLKEMHKLQGSKLSKLALTHSLSTDQLVFNCIDGTSSVVEVPKDRNGAFNSIIGFSGLQWQVLQGKSGEGKSKRH